jgi:uncharacterized protein (TIGR02118 family)
VAQVVVNVMYNAPLDPQAFEDYYAATHMPIAGKIPMVEKIVLLKGLAGPDGNPPAYYRIAQIYFADAATMVAAMASPEALAATSDIANFATGGVSVMMAEAA